MIDLNKKVFGNITYQQIIGSEPAPNKMETMLTAELDVLTGNLECLSNPELSKLKEQQTELEKQVNGRPGAMALSQEKIHLYTKFSQNYVQKITDKLGA